MNLVDSRGVRVPSSYGSQGRLLESRLSSVLFMERHARQRAQLLSLASCGPDMFFPCSSRLLSFLSKSLYSLTGILAHFFSFTILQLSCALLLIRASWFHLLSVVLSLTAGLVSRLRVQGPHLHSLSQLHVVLHLL